jgi:TonB-dependent starch-binding outer membrane protein SusC
LGNDILNPHPELEYYNLPQIYYTDRWTEDNPSQTMFKASKSDPNGNKRVSDLYVHDGSYMRLKQIMFAVNLPKKVTSSLGLESCRVYMSANNILTFTRYYGYDPELGETMGFNGLGVDIGMFPSARSFVFGLNVSL